jgi:putative tricarboxylic transport membrane protein
MNARKYDISIRFFWIALGGFVVIYSYTLGLGKFVNPGPGMLPFLLGCIFLILSSIRLVTVIRSVEPAEEEHEEEGQKKTEYWRLAMIVASLLIWAVVIESLGFLVATFILMTLLYRAAGYAKWYAAILWGLVTVLATYFVFTYLGVRFPPGILRTLGLG